MEYKTARQGDEVKLAKMCLRWAVDMGYDLTLDEIANDILRTIIDGVVIYVEDDGKPAGMMSGVSCYHFWIKETWAHEHWFFIHPDYRNKRIAAKLVDFFCEWAKIKGYQSVIITPNKFGSLNPEILAKCLEKKGMTMHGYTLRKEL